MKGFFQALAAIAVCELAGAIGSLFTAPAINGWYAGLTRPALNPPNWLFAPVWTTLFALMGLALYLVWRKGLSRANVRRAMTFFFIQLVLNVLWTILFFGLHDPFLALIEIYVLWLAILVTLVAFWRISRWAGWLMVPYLAWVSFAIYLNYSIWALNRLMY